MSLLTNPAFRVACAIIVFCFVVTIVAVANDVSLGTIMRDPAASYDFPIYAGVLSYLSIAILTVTAAIAGFGASFRGPHRGLLLAASALTGFLAFDDLFLVHEYVMPDLIGIPERLFYMIYAGALAALLWALIRRKLDLSALKVAIWFLAVSVLADFFKVHGPFSLWLEDYTKLAGFGAWAVFWIGLARQDVGAVRA